MKGHKDIVLKIGEQEYPGKIIHTYWDYDVYGRLTNKFQIKFEIDGEITPLQKLFTDEELEKPPMRYAVLENGEACVLENCGDNWNNNEFATFDEAREYMLDWLGFPWRDYLHVTMIGVNDPVVFGGWGSTIEIRDI